MALPALSTPSPLPRKRKRERYRTAIALASVDGTAVANGNDETASGTAKADSAPLTRRKAIQTNKVPRARHKAIQVDDASTLARRGMTARIDALRVEIRALVADIVQSADVVLLDLMRDEVGSYARHKTAQLARDWAATAGVTLETGLMQIERALPTPGVRDG